MQETHLTYLCKTEFQNHNHFTHVHAGSSSLPGLFKDIFSSTQVYLWSNERVIMNDELRRP